MLAGVQEKTLRKTDPDRMAAVLYALAETIHRIAIVVQPFMPDAASAILDQLSVPADARSFADLGRPIRAGTTLPKPQPVFPRYVEEEGEA